MTKILRFQKLSKPKDRAVWQKHYAFLGNIPIPWAIIIAGVAALLLAPYLENSYITSSNLIVCDNPNITDGDTFRCNGTRIRLAGIDTPEMPGHCRPGRECTPGDPYAARDYLFSISRGSVTCETIDKDVYGRTIARCNADNEDLSCVMISSGYAVQRYDNISC